MHNLEQKRAAHALKSAPEITKGCGGGDPAGVVKKVPSLIISSGILSTLAFAKEKGEGYQSVFEAFADYCDDFTSNDIGLMLEDLSNMSAANLRRITAEFMSYLNYLRRFVEKGD